MEDQVIAHDGARGPRESEVLLKLMIQDLVLGTQGDIPQGMEGYCERRGNCYLLISII